MNNDLPFALGHLAEIRRTIGEHEPAFFLDFDGTLAPIVERPEMADMPADTRQTVAALAELYPVCLISGRALSFLKSKLDSAHIYYAAAHGHRILGPEGSGVDFKTSDHDHLDLEALGHHLRSALTDIEGVSLEIKEVSLAVHYRLVAEPDRSDVRTVVDETMRAFSGYRLLEGKLVYELMPDIPWDKGQAVLWLLKRLRSAGRDVYPVCLGDDLTDESMFTAVLGQGVAVLVGDTDRPTSASFRVRDPDETAEFLRQFCDSPAQGPQHLV